MRVPDVFCLTQASIDTQCLFQIGTFDGCVATSSNDTEKARDCMIQSCPNTSPDVIDCAIINVDPDLPPLPSSSAPPPPSPTTSAVASATSQPNNVDKSNAKGLGRKILDGIGKVASRVGKAISKAFSSIVGTSTSDA